MKQTIHALINVFTKALVLALFCTIGHSSFARPAYTVETADDGHEVINMNEVLNIEGEFHQKEARTPVIHGREGDMSTDSQKTRDEANKRAKEAAAAQAAAAAKASADALLRSQAAKEAARQLLLRLDDPPLEFDSFIVEKAWDHLIDKIPQPIMTLLKLLTPDEFGQDSWLDKARTREEMLGARYLIEKELKDKEDALKIKAENDAKLGLPPETAPPLKPIESKEEKAFYNAMRNLASARSPDIGYVVDQLIEHGQHTSGIKVSMKTVNLIGGKLLPLVPPNACVIPNTKWACPMVDGKKIGDPCYCPGIGQGSQNRRDNNDICEGAITSCRFNISLPVGTPCNCAGDFELLGPIPYGRIRRPVQ